MIDRDKPFILQKKRLGRILRIDEDKKFGFIEAEDFRENVFFHFSQWEPSDDRDRVPKIGQFVEFEIDEPHRIAEGRLRAITVKATKRPDGMKLDDTTDPHLRAKHHPKARRKKPGWRDIPKDPPHAT